MLTFVFLSFFTVNLRSTNKEFSLDNYQWKNRVILIVADGTNTLLRNQTELFLLDKKGLSERDLLIFAVGENHISEIIDGNEFPIPVTFKESLSINNNSFEVILIGKDGGIKLREKSPITRQRLYGTIDAMPMRQAEMRRQK